MGRFAVTTSLLAALLASTGCAGPTTPLGAPWATDSSQVKNGPLSFVAGIFQMAGRMPSSLRGANDKEPISNIRFFPPRQKLHAPGPMTIVIEDLGGIPANYKLLARYNGVDVTANFLRQARIDYRDDGRQMVVRIPVLRLSPDKDHHIEFIYGKGSRMTTYGRYLPPTCHATDPKQILTTEKFNPENEIVSLIDSMAKKHGFSPAFTAALVAQESSFNPRTVSWARAIGLTQVTPLADEELAKKHDDWPRYPGLNDLPLPWIKMLILSGTANESNEWRLDPQQSLHGGLLYMKMLVNRWSEPATFAKIKAKFDDPEAEVTRLALASYNSGYTRVSTALERSGKSWLSAPELGEARKYVNRIFSFCDHFSHGEVFHENET